MTRRVLAGLNEELLQKEHDTYRRWWLRRYTLAEIHTLAQGLVSRDDRTTPVDRARRSTS